MLEDKLKDWFGFKTFKPGQKDIIQSVLEGKHTLGILPTGSGKVYVINSQHILSKSQR